MKIVVCSPGNLAEFLRAKGIPLDMRCGGQGRCGRCRVKLISGEWSCNGAPVNPPAEVPACATRWTGGAGVVEIPEPITPARPKAASGFTPPASASQETVIAVDIGTTAVAAAKLRGGEVLAKSGAFNAQIAYGDNVVSRIAHAARPGGMDELRQALLETLRQVVDDLDPVGVTRVAVSGNTVMCCLLHGLDPAPVGAYPFRAPALRFPARGDLLPPFEVLTLPCISGFLGGDVTSGLYSSALEEGEMLVDLGTNCEIVFRTGQGYFGTSAASGPAFEGRGLRSGMRAASGAIEHFSADGAFSVLGGVAPRGICGTAYVDYLAVERASGRLNEFGRFVSPAEKYREIAPGVGIGEDDVEALLKAKAAIGAGIAALEEYCGAHASKLILAGSFASGLDTSNAVAVGMLPPGRDFAKIGNASLSGAAALAVDPGLMGELTRLSALPKEIPLALLPGFDSRFANALLLP